MHPSVMEFGTKHIKEEHIKDKDVIELGSRYINGTLADHVKSLGPKSFVGIDFIAGKNVDKVIDLNNLMDVYEKESVDFVLSTELMEHTENWIKVINNTKDVLKVGGYLLLTTRGEGFPLHGYPYDYWRYSMEDIKKIFADFEIIEIEPDVTTHPGVLLLAKKTKKRRTKIDNIELYNINSKQREKCKDVETSTK